MTPQNIVNAGQDMTYQDTYLISKNLALKFS